MSQSIKLNDNTFIDGSGIWLNNAILSDDISAPLKCKRLSSDTGWTQMDFNAVTSSGLYACHEFSSNTPTGNTGNYYLLVISWGEGRTQSWCFQLAVRMNYSSTIYLRQLTNGTWESWTTK